MNKKFEMTKEGWTFSVLFFLFAVYYSFSKAHFAHWGNVKVTFFLVHWSTLLSSLIYAVILVLFYLVCTLLPSRRIVALPTIITLLLAGQELALAYYTLPVGDILGGLVLLIGTLTILYMAYINAKISFNIIDSIVDADEGNYFKRWFNRVKVSLAYDWKPLVISIVIYMIINASMLMTLTFK
ncbi:hypothetical protein [Apilactobacillus kunkeei]|uniref:hypothetical protein n=1 Tax=Apilactobacillus kunkeei TaxID=148814 RepID=UPI0006C6C275|nr:hypothetical protein [Apilactobacillus kunkeei]KOY72156.1 hypothetical protein RZ55_06720 [Apilactobacillus kunkeei]KOY75429.1 hypothetical protein RZ54_04010 [Apilactobacillus kunkeei]